MNEAALTGDASRLTAYILGPKYVEAAFPEESSNSKSVESKDEAAEDKGEDSASSESE